MNDWSDGQTNAANTRIPYLSSLVQLEGAPPPMNEPIIVRGEKDWQQWAKDMNDWSDGQTNAANTRIPYLSSLSQFADESDEETEE